MGLTLGEADASLARDLRGVLALEGAIDPRVLAIAGEDGPGALVALALPGAEPSAALLGRVGLLLEAAAREGERLMGERLREPEGLGDAAALARRRKREREAVAAEASREGKTGDRPWTPRGEARLRMPRLGQGATGLASRDTKLRRRWLDRFVAILVENGVPAAREAERSSDPGRQLAGLAGRARAATLRLRVRAWEKMSRWLDTRFGHKWPASEAEVLDYMWMVLDESPKASFPAQLRSSLKWIEGRSGLPEADHLCKSSLLVRSFEQAEADMQAAGTDRRKAPRLPAVVVAALELLVCDWGAAPAARVVAWARLLKVYGALRADDLQRLAPEDVSLREQGLTGVLRRITTTGAGKKVRTRPVFIPAGRGLVSEDWLAVAGSG